MQSKFWRVPELNHLECLTVNGSSHCFPRHWHHTYVIEVVEEGRNEFLCNDRIYSAGPGDIMVIHPGEIHTGYPTGRSVLSYRCFYPSQNLMADLNRQVTGWEYAPRFQSNVIHDTSLAAVLNEAHRSLESSAGSTHTVTAIAALRKLIARYSVDREEHLGTTPSFSKSAMGKAAELLTEKYSENILLTDLSAIFGLSEYHFLRTFKKFTGIAPYEYLIATRIEESRKLLSEGMSIAETAARTGFFDQSHLNRHFKRILGITPGKYASPMTRRAGVRL